MRVMKIAFFILVLLVCVSGFEKKVEASTSFFLNFSTLHPGYHAYYYPYWGYYRPHYYWGAHYRPYPYRYSYGYGEVRAEVKPNSARVYVDGDYVGVADDFDGWWQRLQLEPGKHRIIFRAPGYVPYAVTVRVLPGRDYHIKHTMEPGDDVIEDQEMRLERDYERDYERDRDYDRDRDRDDSEQEERHHDRDWEERDKDRERSETSESERPQTQNTRALVLQVHPSDATIYVDGSYYGTAESNQSNELQVLLPEGTHKIEIVRPGYESFTKEIRIDENSNERLVVHLQKK